MQDQTDLDKFFVVGIGCSAGGIEALRQLVPALKKETPASYVIVQHLSPDHESMMTDIIRKFTDLKVETTTDDIKLRPGTIYTTPPGQFVTLKDGYLRLTSQDREHNPKPYYPIDVFFKSLADHLGDEAIGVILSGTGTDGFNGSKSLKEHGGLVIVQDLKEAAFRGMPETIKGAGGADAVAKASEIPQVIDDIIFKRRKLDSSSDHSVEEFSKVLSRILELVAAQTNIDFSNYKKNTLERRLKRRMSFLKLDDFEAYLEKLKNDSREANELVKDFLINVTSFFRDPASYEVIKEKVVADLIEKTPSGGKIRVWVPACSTGEEVFSLAMLFYEKLEHSHKKIELRLFGTDVDADAVQKAQVGRYTEAQLTGLPMQYRSEFMESASEHTFEVRRFIRDRVVFSVHNIISDPPFTRMDLISFRNCMIYFEKAAQKEALENIEYALNKGGFLWLGKSEDIREDQTRLTVIDSSSRLFRKEGDFAPVVRDKQFDLTRLTKKPSDRFKKSDLLSRKDHTLFLALQDLVDRDFYPSVIVNSDGKPIRFIGDVKRFFEIKTGDFDGSLSHLLISELKTIASLGLRRVFSDGSGKVVESHTILNDAEKTRIHVRFRRLSLKSDDQIALISFIVDDEKREHDSHSTPDLIPADEMIQLREELDLNKYKLKLTIDDLETANEELQSTNEELIASNEELQSTNEELQSVNEELHTMNHEYQGKIDELSEATRDMESLMGVAKVATIFLDADFKIRKLSPLAQEILHLLPSDHGRPITVFAKQLYPTFIQDCQQVNDDHHPIERQIYLDEIGWSLIKIHPYYKIDQEADGVVVVVIDVAELQAVKESQSWLIRYFLEKKEISYSINTEGQIVSWPESASKFFGYEEDEILKKDESVLIPFSKRSDLKVVSEKTSKGEPILFEETSRLLKNGSEKKVRVIGFPEYDKSGGVSGASYILYAVDESNSR